MDSKGCNALEAIKLLVFVGEDSHILNVYTILISYYMCDTLGKLDYALSTRDTEKHTGRAAINLVQ